MSSPSPSPAKPASSAEPAAPKYRVIHHTPPEKYESIGYAMLWDASRSTPLERPSSG